MIKKSGYLALIALTIIVFFLNTGGIKPTVTPATLEEYLRSQDIDFDVKPRIHISDSQIYSVSGFLYALGSPPSAYNFQHPPLIKYSFGLSEVLLGSAMWSQLIFSVLIILLTYHLGVKTFSVAAGFLASILLLFDPLYTELSKFTLLDMGHTVFALSFIIARIYYSKSLTGSVISGILFAFFAMSKFWTPAIIILLLTESYRINRYKRLLIKDSLILLGTAFVISNFTYVVDYIKTPGFNIFFWQAKILKFMLHHDTATTPGATVILFLTGNLTAWWNGELVRDSWSIAWPLTLLSAVFLIFQIRKLNTKSFIAIIPIFFIATTITQAPFSRYFIVVLPFLYLCFSQFLFQVIKLLHGHPGGKNTHRNDINDLRRPKRDRSKKHVSSESQTEQ